MNIERAVEITEHLLRLWDPLLVMRGTSVPPDEYDAYAWGIAERVLRGDSRQELLEYLAELQREMFEQDPLPKIDGIFVDALLFCLQDGRSQEPNRAETD